METLSSTQVITPQHQGKVGAFVPHEDGRDITQERQTQKEKFRIDKNLTEALLKLKETCENRQRAEWLAIKKQFVLMRQYFDGNQYGVVNDRFEWTPDTTQANEEIFFENIIQTHVQTALTEITQANVQLSFSYNSVTDSRKGEVLTKFCEQRYKYYRQRLFNASIKQQEKLSALLNGLSARYTFFEYETEKNGQSEVIINKQTDEAVEKTTVCAECYAPQSSEQCANCGNDEFIELIEADAGNAGSYQSNEKMRGSNRFVNVDPLGLTFDLKAVTVRDTPYIIWKQVIMDEVLDHQYPDVELGGTIDSELMDSTLSVSGGHSYQKRTSQGKQFEQCWFDYSLYCKTTLDADVKLRNGKILKAGTKLGEAFPNGLYIAVNDKNILDLWGENKNRKWTIAPYVTRLGTMVGAGMSALISQQDRKNDLVNLEMVTIFNDTYRKEFLNSKYLTNGDIPDNPRERAEIENLPDGVKIIGQAIDVLPPSGMSPMVEMVEQRIESASQALVGTFSTGGAGMPDLKAATDTLGGMQLYREQTVGRFAPMLELQADLLDKEQAYQFFENDQEFLSPEDWRELAGDYGKEAIEMFLDCDIRRELVIEVVRDSYMPQTTSQKQLNAQGYFTMLGLMMQTGQSSPEQLSRIAEIFHQPQMMSSFQPNYDKARRSIAVFAELCEEVIATVGDAPTANIMTNPMVAKLAQLVLIDSGLELDVEMDDQQAMIDGYRDWWASDDGQNAPNLLKATVLLRVRELYAAWVAKSQEELARQIAAQQPMVQQQQEDEMEQQKLLKAADEEAAAKEEEGMMMQGLAEMSEADAGREHETMLKEVEIADNERQRAHEQKLAAKESAKQST